MSDRSCRVAVLAITLAASFLTGSDLPSASGDRRSRPRGEAPAAPRLDRRINDPVPPLPGPRPHVAVAVETQALPDPAGARMGGALASAGDLNGDAIDDLLVGGPGYAVSANAEAGVVAVYLGSTSQAELASPDIVFTGESAHDRAGVSVAGNFDFNGDADPDILIGAEQVDRSGSPSPTGSGKIYLIYFDPTDTLHYPNINNAAVDIVSLSLVGQVGGIPGVVFTGEALGDQAGFSVAAGGRIDAGTSPDLLIGAPGADPGSRTNAGAVYAIFNQIFTGPVALSSVGTTVAGVRYEGEFAEDTDPGDRLGWSVAFPGNVMGLPGDDIAMGAPYRDTIVSAGSQLDAGTVYLVEGGSLTSASAVPVVNVACTLHLPSANCTCGNPSCEVEGTQILGDQAGELLGFSVSGGGDNQVDGVPDLLIGAPLYDAPVPFAGPEAASLSAGLVAQASCAFGKGIIEVCAVGEVLTFAPIPGVIWTGAGAGDQLGYAISGAGDISGDGMDEITLGAPMSRGGAGTVYMLSGLVAGSPTRGTVGIGSASRDEVFGQQLGEHAGSALAGAGDLVGLGRHHFAAGAPERAVGANPNAGVVSVTRRTF